MVYILRIEGSDFYKIGLSKDFNGVIERRKTFKQCFRREVELSIAYLIYPLYTGHRYDYRKTYYDSRWDESRLHDYFKHQRISSDELKHLLVNERELTTEWFHIPEGLDNKTVTRTVAGRAISYDEFLSEVVFDLDI